MSSDSGRLVGENVFKRKKRKTTAMPDSPTRKKIPTGAKKATPTMAIPDAPKKAIPTGAKPTGTYAISDAPKKAIPTGATPVKPMTGKIDPRPNKPIPSGATNMMAADEATAKASGKVKQRRPRPQNPDLLKGGMNGVSTLTSALTVGKQLNGMANAMKQKKPF
jgi:hypothetical protein